MHGAQQHVMLEVGHHPVWQGAGGELPLDAFGFLVDRKTLAMELDVVDTVPNLVIW